ncbi:hypothetical protein CY35_17G018800 [Sphagnum magellanicum]|nr:hypothetical protein CY35_17G018800 [Sphagnum magellanicum]
MDTSPDQEMMGKAEDSLKSEEGNTSSEGEEKSSSDFQQPSPSSEALENSDGTVEQSSIQSFEDEVTSRGSGWPSPSDVEEEGDEANRHLRPISASSSSVLVGTGREGTSATSNAGENDKVETELEDSDLFDDSLQSTKYPVISDESWEKVEVYPILTGGFEDVSMGSRLDEELKRDLGSMRQKKAEMEEEEDLNLREKEHRHEGMEAEDEELLRDLQDLDQNSTSGLDYTEESATREVYKFPIRDIDAVEPGVSPSQLLVWPADFIIQAISFQIKLIVQSVYFALWLCSLTYAVLVFPLQKSIEATNLATNTVIDVYALTSQIRPMVTEGVAHAGPTIKHITKRCGCGCLAAIYVSFILGFLLIPAFFLDVFLVRSFIEDPIEIHQTLHFDYTREHPTAVVPLLPPKVLAKAKELAVKKPEKAHSFRAIPKSHKFHVTVFLTLPESDHNRKLGIFQVSAELLSIRGQVITRATRPCMLKFHSSPIRYAKNLLMGVPFLMGLSSESQKLAIRIIENHEDTSVPTVFVRILLECKAGLSPGEGLPELYSAELQIISVLSPMKDFIRKWRWTFYVWSLLGLFMVEVLIVLCCCHQVLLPRRLLQGLTEGFGGEHTEVHERSSAVDSGSRKGAKHKRRVNFSDEIPTAQAFPVSDKSAEESWEQESFLGGDAESSSTLAGPSERSRLRQRSRVEKSKKPVEASSSWTVPPLQESLNFVDTKFREVEDMLRNVGEAGVAEGIGITATTFKANHDVKGKKSI